MGWWAKAIGPIPSAQSDARDSRANRVPTPVNQSATQAPLQPRPGPDPGPRANSLRRVGFHPTTPPSPPAPRKPGERLPVGWRTNAVSAALYPANSGLLLIEAPSLTKSPAPSWRLLAIACRQHIALQCVRGGTGRRSPGAFGLIPGGVAVVQCSQIFGMGRYQRAAAIHRQRRLVSGSIVVAFFVFFVSYFEFSAEHLEGSIESIAFPNQVAHYCGGAAPLRDFDQNILHMAPLFLAMQSPKSSIRNSKLCNLFRYAEVPPNRVNCHFF